MALEDFHDQFIEPKALCRNCEYFDGGGMGSDGEHVNYHGDCLNSQAPRYQTHKDKSCNHFWPCSTRWPDCDHD